MAPLSLDGGFTFIRYVGTDPEAFQKAFPGAQVVEGTAIPPGQRGVLLGKLYAEEWLKLRAARRLDKIKEARDLNGRRIAKDEELQRWVKENTGQTRDILLQLDPVRTREAVRRLQAALRTTEEDPAKLVAALLDTDDANFDERYRLFYAELAPLLQLYSVKVGDYITIKAPSRSGYVNSVNVPVYGFVEFRGLERSALAGMMSVLDIHTWRDLYGYLTPERAAEIRKLKERAGARSVAREDAEAALFGGGDGGAGAGGRGAGAGHRRGDGCSPAGAARARATTSSRGATPRPRPTPGVALNAAVILDDPRRIQRDHAAARGGGREGRHEGEGGHLARGLGHRGPVDGAAPHGALPGRPHHLRGGARHHQQRHGHGHPPAGEGDRHHARHRRAAPLRAGPGGGRGRHHRARLRRAGGAALGILIVHAIGWAGGIAATNDTMYFLFSGPALIPRLGTASLLTSVAIVFLVSILSALYPAVLAMRVTPLEAMQSDE